MTDKKKAAAVAVSAVVVISLILFIVSCSGVEKTAYTENWDTVQGRFAPSGNLLADNDGQPKGEGISYVSTPDGGIRVTADALGEKGGAAAAVVTSKAKTPLDGLTVTLEPDDIVFTRDFFGRSEVISVLWSVDPLDGFGDAAHYDHLATNGLRNMAQPTKGLCVTINNSYNLYDGTQTASNVMITLIDGDFTDAVDGRLGYRWSFTARNRIDQSPNSDGTGISTPYESVDLSDGLTVAVRSDEERGMYVTVNGKAYFSGEEVSYFPNNVKDWMAADSMTSARADIDLSPLDGHTGYVSVGFCGTSDRSLGYGCTVSEINGVPASFWKGEGSGD